VLSKRLGELLLERLAPGGPVPIEEPLVLANRADREQEPLAVSLGALHLLLHAVLEAPRRQETGQRVRDRPFGPGLRAARVLDRQGDVERELPEALDVEAAQPRRRLAPAPGRGQKDAEHARDLLVDPDRYECVGCDPVLLHDASQLIGSETRGAELPPRF